VITDRQVGYAVGRYMVIAKTMDGGATWVDQENIIFNFNVPASKQSVSLRSVVVRAPRVADTGMLGCPLSATFLAVGALLP
jgi:photosystem II stability/assembly factor-like uncharacterized protein